MQTTENKCDSAANVINDTLGSVACKLDDLSTMLKNFEKASGTKFPNLRHSILKMKRQAISNGVAFENRWMKINGITE